ncbi:hypothetical protein DHEL01_v206456 [Diaporthe helianthi]|uniref:Cytochrome P450 n=1 Tax=Diaporthe helianthi TaxID=158607 RepID=A0A2P5HY12_DIAHE|nr:hypothetical protein DHEL01_v206456 [Diaporthe helianthi]
MYKMITAIAALSAAVVGVTARPSIVQSRATASNFSLFAYGLSTDSEIGGYPIFYYEGLSYIANPAKVNYTSGYVLFTEGTDDTTQWVANPLTTRNEPWSESLFYVPAVAGPTGFYKPDIRMVTEDAIITTGFTFYGETAMLSINGSLYTEWYAVKTGVDGLWSVGWNATGAGVTDAELITVRGVVPPNVVYPDKSEQSL